MSPNPHQREPLQRPVGADEVLDEVVRGRHQQLRRGRVLGEVAALLQDRDPVAHLDRLVDVVGDEEDRLPDLGLQAEELVLEALAVDRVDRAEGLVHQHHRRVGGEGPGDADPLLLSAGELAREAVAEVRIEPDQVEQLADALVGALPVPAEQLRDRGDVLGDRPVREQADLLDHVADLPAQLGRVAVAHGVVADQDVALGDLDRPVGHPHRGGLPAARWADQDADLAGRHVQGEMVDRGHLLPRIPLRYVPVGNGRCLVSSLHCARSYPADR